LEQEGQGRWGEVAETTTTEQGNGVEEEEEEEEEEAETTASTDPGWQDPLPCVFVGWEFFWLFVLINILLALPSRGVIYYVHSMVVPPNT
jgi:hypothetical protein